MTSLYYLNEFRSDLKRVENRINSYLESPSEEATHNVRTSIRRLEASSKLLPKALRRGDFSKFMKLCSNFFKITNQLRDLDITRAKLAEYKTLGVDERALRTMLKTRKKLVLQSQKKALKLKKCHRVVFTPDLLRNSKLQKKFRKESLEMSDRADRLLPLVLKDSENIEELHLLRKTCKKLRYLIEVDQATKNSIAMIDLLKKRQDLLGRIRDCDVAIHYLERLKPNRHEGIIAKEKKVRQDLYLDFTALARNENERFGFLMTRILDSSSS